MADAKCFQCSKTLSTVGNLIASFNKASEPCFRARNTRVLLANLTLKKTNPTYFCCSFFSAAARQFTLISPQKKLSSFDCHEIEAIVPFVAMCFSFEKNLVDFAGGLLCLHSCTFMDLHKTDA